jgi:hypothetical protein
MTAKRLIELIKCEKRKTLNRCSSDNSIREMGRAYEKLVEIVLTRFGS